MKKLLFLLISILLSVPAWADDLHPETSDQAIKEYQDFWKIADPAQLGNHVVWKLYVFRVVPQNSSPGAAMEFIIAGLTPIPKDGYLVRLRINQLYNFLRPMPKRGDVVVAGGRILNHREYKTILPKKDVELKILTMDLDGAVSLPQEHIDLKAIPTVRP